MNYMQDILPEKPSELISTGLWDLQGVLNSIPKPFYLSTLFADLEPVAICRPLFPPFDHYAITHFGQVFLQKPLKTWNWNKELLLLDPTSMVFPENTKTGRALVRLQDPQGRIRKSFFIDRLILERFYQVGLGEKVEVSYLDGNYNNPRMENLEAFLVNRNETIPAAEQDWADVRPLH